MIPKHFNEENPRKKFYKKRVRRWPEIIGHRFFNADYTVGFFDVKKVWTCYEYIQNALTPDLKSHWFRHHTIEIKTENGERLIMHKLPFDLQRCFDVNYDKYRMCGHDFTCSGDIDDPKNPVE